MGQWLTAIFAMIKLQTLTFNHKSQLKSPDWPGQVTYKTYMAACMLTSDAVHCLVRVQTGVLDYKHRHPQELPYHPDIGVSFMQIVLESTIQKH